MLATQPPLNILVVEDNENLRESICDALEDLGHHVRGIDCAEALPEQTDLVRIDLAILDLNLPGEDGLSLAGRLRTTHPDIGLIMLTARAQGEDRAAGYARGADIYLTKPASLDELKQAIGALARRLQPSPRSGHAKDARLDLLQRCLHLADGQVVSLTANETALLAAFVRAAQQMLETWQIAEVLAMDIECLNKPAIELHIVRLRKKLPHPQGRGSAIQSVRGRGYQLCVPLKVTKGF